MDGTLTQAAHDFDAIRQQLGILPGLPILEAIEKMPAKKASDTHMELHRIEMQIASESRPQPGAADTLALLQANGFKLGILTRNAEDIALETLNAAGLGEFFTEQEIIGRDKCTPKPDPAGIYMHLEQWQAPASATTMVGDYLFDLQTGRNAGITTVHFDPAGEFSWPDLTDVKIERIEDICSYL